VISVSPTGQVTAHGVGTSQLTATYQTLTASAPLNVSQDSDLQAVTVLSCGGSMLVGLQQDCAATARVAGVSGEVNIATRADWSSTDASVIAVSNNGRVTAVGAGQAIVAATYHGKTGTMPFTITRATEDALSFSGGYTVGQLKPGNTVQIAIEVLYSVVSVSTGTLVMRVIDQAGEIATSPSVAVRAGSGILSLNVTVAIPSTSTRLCSIASLTIGANTLTAPGFCGDVSP